MNYFYPMNGGASKKPRGKEPDKFDGRDSSKLENFLLQCSLYFHSDPEAFANDRDKCLTAVTYLSDFALRWIRPDLLAPYLTPRLLSWQQFVHDIHSMFGDKNASLKAIQKIKDMKMHEDWHASRYIIDFRSYANITGYNEVALADAFYDGLAARIQTAMVPYGRPGNLDTLMQLAQDVDDLHWEHQNNLRRTQRNNRPSSSNQSSQAANNQQNTRGQNQQNRVTTTALKLTEEEKQRRRDEGLCIYCGSSGHLRANCPVAKNNNQANRNTQSTSNTQTPPRTTNNRPANTTTTPATTNNKNTTNTRQGRAAFTFTTNSEETPSATLEEVPANDEAKN